MFGDRLGYCKLLERTTWRGRREKMREEGSGTGGGREGRGAADVLSSDEVKPSQMK